MRVKHYFSTASSDISSCHHRQIQVLTHRRLHGFRHDENPTCAPSGRECRLYLVGTSPSANPRTLQLAPAFVSTPPPPFTTTQSRAAVLPSLRGSPSTPIRTPHFPPATTPVLSDHPSRSAALTVAAWIACSGVRPNLTMTANSCAFGPCG